MSDQYSHFGESMGSFVQPWHSCLGSAGIPSPAGMNRAVDVALGDRAHGGLGSAEVGLSDLRGFFQPKRFRDSVISGVCVPASLPEHIHTPELSPRPALPQHQCPLLCPLLGHVFGEYFWFWDQQTLDAQRVPNIKSSSIQGKGEASRAALGAALSLSCS